MKDNQDILRSLTEAWNEMNDETRSYLLGFGEGYIAGRQTQAEV